MAPKKKKAAPINYSSTQTARTTAPTFGYDDWFEDGVQQESQGDRYLHGPKSARHYNNSVISYQLASALSPKAFDPVYNAARVMFSLASDHLEAPTCVQMMLESIRTFRIAHTLAISPDERIDSTFNLAQALVALQELYDDEAVTSMASTSKVNLESLAFLLEAKQLFAQVETIQRASMDAAFNQIPSEAAVMEDNSMASADTSLETTRIATEGRIVTPRLVIDTLVEALELDLNLFGRASTTSDESSAIVIAESAANALSRAYELHRSDPVPVTTTETELTLAQLSLNATCTTTIPVEHPLYLTQDQLLRSYESLLASIPNSVSYLSAFADYLLSSSPPSSPFLKRSLSYFSSANKLLASSLSPPKDVPSYRIPSLISSNLTSQVEAYLLLHHLTSDTSPDLLICARDQAIEAIKASRLGYSVELSPTLKILKLPGDARRDWTTVKAARLAWFSLLRVLMRLDVSDGGGNWLGLLKGWEKISGRDWKADLRWVLEEEGWEGDRIWIESDGAEEREWRKALAL